MQKDAFTLARLLGEAWNIKSSKHKFLQRCQKAFSLYDAFRRPVVERISRRAAYTGHLYEYDIPGVCDSSEPDESEDTLIDRVGKAANQEWAWQGKTGVDLEVTELLKRFKEEAE